MKVQFCAVSVENFGSFTTEQTLELADRQPGLYFMRGRNETQPRLGSNGSGKSTLLSKALTWAIYGRTTGGLRATDLSPWSGGKKPCRVTVEVTCDDKAHILSRATQPNRLVIDTREATQEDVEALIGGLSLDTFSNTILLPQGSDLFLDLPPRGKLELLTSTLKLGRWDARAASANKVVRALQDELTELGGKALGLGTSATRLEGVLEDAKKAAAEWEQERQLWLEQITRERGKLEAARDEAQKRLDTAQLKADRVALQLDELGHDEKPLDQKASQTGLEADRAKHDLKNLQKQRTDLQADLAVIRDTCPTCGQPLKGESLTKQRATLKAKIAAVDEQIETQKALLAKLDKQIEPLLDQLNKLGERRDELEKSEERVAAEIRLYSSQVTETKTKLAAWIERAEDDKEQSNPHTEQVAKLRRQVSQVRTEIEETAASISSRQQRLSRTEYWVKGFRDVQLFILEEVLGEIEVACNAMLCEIGLDGWEMRFAVERETQSGSVSRGLNVTVLSPDNPKPVRWECWSGGEGQRLRVIGALALSEILLNSAGVQTNLEVLDEPTQHMSPEGTRDLCAFLAARATALGVQTWWVDHAAVESAHFADVVTVVKDANGSRIEEW